MRFGFKTVAVLAVLACGWGGDARLAAQAINPIVHKKAYEKAAETAEVVAKVRVLSAVCTDYQVQGKARSATLQVTLQVLESDKGPLKKNDAVVVTRRVMLPAGPGPGMYGWVGEVHRFPFVPGVKGQVALNWDREKRAYVPLAGWVEQPNRNAALVPTTVGKAFVAGDAPEKK